MPHAPRPRPALLALLPVLPLLVGATELPARQGAELAIVDVRVFDGERVLPRATVLVRGGRIASVSARPPARLPANVVDGRGRTLLPGLIDSHFHVQGRELAQAEAMRFGVTTLLDQFGRPELDAVSRARGRRPGLAEVRAAGSGATAPGGHGTQFGWPTPTLTRPDSADAFVAARLAEGSDYIKIVVEPSRATLDPATVRALAAAARRRGRLAVAHVTRAADAEMALRAGVDGLVHVWTDSGAVPAVSTLAAARGAFVVPTLVTFLQRNTAGEEGRVLAADARVDARLADFFRAGIRDAPWVRGYPDSLVRARREDAPRFRRQLYGAVADLRRAGVRILAGTDAQNFGISPAFLHRELELLVSAGLTPVEALAAATSAPADAFRLADRGRIRPGLRADLVLVEGDPTTDVTATRGIVAVWKEGVPLAPPPRVGVARRLELMGILLRLADDGRWPFLPPQQLQPYASEIDRHFGPFRGHPAVARIRELRDSQGFQFDAAIRLALNLGEPPELRERAPLDGPADPLDHRWRTPAARPLVEELRRFAADTRADAFFDAHQALYDSASARLRRLAGTGLDLGWFEPFFGVSPPGELRVAPMLAMSRAAFGARVQPAGAPPERWIVMQHMREDSAGISTFPEEYAALLAHEVIHPFVDLVGAYADSASFARSGPRLFAVADRVPPGLYPGWRDLVDDALTRAATARYVLATRGPAAAREQIAEDAALGHVWNQELFDLLAEYEARRGDHPTLAAFRPRLAAYFDSLPGRVEMLGRRFDAARPRVLGLSIENGSGSVDPRTTEIVVRFDRPVRLTGRCALPLGGRRDLLPRATGCALDPTSTVLRIGVGLEPGRSYQFVLDARAGSGLRSAEGVPIAPHPVRFSTRP